MPDVATLDRLDNLSLDNLQPPLSPPENELVNSYGGWSEFCAVYGFKPTKPTDNEEAHAIVKQMVQADLWYGQISRR